MFTFGAQTHTPYTSSTFSSPSCSPNSTRLCRMTYSPTNLRVARRTWARSCLRSATTSSGPSFVDCQSGSSGASPSRVRIRACLATYVAFARRLSATRATLIALFCTFSEAFDVPVYWPILVIYFFILFTLTMRRQIQ